jgi:hypothetical protein
VILVKLMGGIGNQMFQYALGRQIADLYHVPLKLDVSSFQSDRLRSYNLGCFNIQEDFASAEEIAQFKAETAVKGLSSLAQKLLPYYRRSMILERYFYQYDPNIMKARKHVYLEGYWQNERYFKHIEPTIRAEFTIKSPPDALNADLAQRIQGSMAVGVHVRRGDYASNVVIREWHGLVPLDYYYAAAEQLAACVDKPHFFIFSDDPAWVQENLHFDYPTTYVTHNSAEKSDEDLRLMSLCKHHIIANSSFSWWAAWLCTYPDQKVFAPAKWIKNPALDASDVVLPSWHRL